MAEITLAPEGKLELSQISQALIQATKALRPRPKPDDYTKISVSRAVSFFAIAYEKVRNTIEFREEHLMRRAAIERIAKRRLSMNLTGKGEGSNIVRELLWARYFPPDSLSEIDSADVQAIIDIYINLRAALITGRPRDTIRYLDEFLYDLLTCEIEEVLTPDIAQRENIFTYFIFQILKDKIKIPDIQPDIQNAFLLTTIEKTYRKSDIAYQRYHLFNVFYQPIAKYSVNDLKDLAPKLPKIFEKIDDTLKNPMIDKIGKFVKKQLPPFLILFDLIKTYSQTDLKALFSDKEKLWTEVELLCRQKYAGVQKRLRGLAVRSLIYVFITKMLLAIVLEGPLSQYFFGEIEWISIIINSLFPPFFMLVIILFNRVPDEENTKRIFQRIVNILDADESFEKKVVLIAQKAKSRRPALQVGFTLFYTGTFIITFFLIWLLLTALHFNAISQLIFLFFVSTIAFFAHRIKNVTNEYKLIEKDSFFTPFLDFFFMPMLAMGKFFSSELAKLNFFTFVFDILIEAPYKLIIEVVEEWISFTRTKKEEII
ncbi:hypothetical protein KBB12_02710 [Candidatus Woesebacteria bacterium]|nr:hypothetical protein [Candidatus Woesebacteria bacterium]